MAQLGNSAVTIIGNYLHDEANAVWCISLVDDFLEFGAFKLARAPLNRPLDIVLGHVCLFGTVNSQPQAWVRLRIAAPLPCRDGDFLR